jgi:hypothetical protein
MNPYQSTVADPGAFEAKRGVAFLGHYICVRQQTDRNNNTRIDFRFRASTALIWANTAPGVDG